jgi:hypothetical protein
MMEVFSKKLKIKHEFGPRSKGLGITPLYKTFLELGDGMPINHREFVEWYGHSLEGLSPKRIRIPRNVTMEEIHKCFGPIHNRNGYSFVFNENLEIITKVESLWMIIHQKMCVLASRIILLGMAKGVVMDLKGDKMNWAMYVEWTN